MKPLLDEILPNVWQYLNFQLGSGKLIWVSGALLSYSDWKVKHMLLY